MSVKEQKTYSVVQYRTSYVQNMDGELQRRSSTTSVLECNNYFLSLKKTKSKLGELPHRIRN